MPAHIDGHQALRLQSDTGAINIPAVHFDDAGTTLRIGHASVPIQILGSTFNIPVVRDQERALAQTGSNASIATYTPTADGTFEISANVLVTTATTHSFNVICSYTDEGGSARNAILPFVLVAGSALVVAIANANGTVPYMGIPITIRAKAATAITVTTSGTFTTVAYNVDATIKQIA
jgi:hypothetical protein